MRRAVYFSYGGKYVQEKKYMPNRTELLIAKFIQYRKVYEYVGGAEISRQELLDCLDSLSVIMAQSDIPQKKVTIEELEPFLIEKRKNCYAMDFDALGTVLHDFLIDFLPGIFSCERVRTLVQKYIPGKLICDASEVELDKQSYKYLYETLKDKYNCLERDFHSQRFDYEDCQRELASLNADLQNLKESGSMYEDSTKSLMQFISRLLHEDIQINSVYAADGKGRKIETASDKKTQVEESSLAICPGIYNFQRPSWFTELHNELNKENAGKKVVKNTIPFLNRILRERKSICSDNLTPEEKADAIDRKRREEITKLINDAQSSNEEKYIKYMLLTPGMTKEYMKTLNGASELGLDARTVIQLLEQPKESFNKEIIEAYVSKAHKGLEYNLKQELAEELIKGEWTIHALVNGADEVFQLFPYEKIQELAKQFEKVYEALGKRSESLSATMALSDSASETQENENNSKTAGSFDQAWENMLNDTLNDDEADQSEYEEDENDDFSGFDKEAF